MGSNRTVLPHLLPRQSFQLGLEMFPWQLSSPDSFFLDLLTTLAGQT